MSAVPVSDQVFDLFITHAWRYHDDWTRMSELLDEHLQGSWRNFSVPWYDPALDPNTPLGKELIHEWLEQQIIPAGGVILLSSVFENKSARKWVELEVTIARTHGKPIVGVPPFGQQNLSAEAATWIDRACGWDAKEIISALDVRPAP
jgi:hypothetical protein